MFLRLNSYELQKEQERQKELYDAKKAVYLEFLDCLSKLRIVCKLEHEDDPQKVDMQVKNLATDLFPVLSKLSLYASEKIYTNCINITNSFRDGDLYKLDVLEGELAEQMRKDLYNQQRS